MSIRISYYLLHDLYFCFFNKVFDTFFVLTIAQIFKFLNIFLIFSDLNKIITSSSNILLISFWISKTEPGKMQHNLSALFLLSEESTVIQAEIFLFFHYWILQKASNTLVKTTFRG